MEGNLAQQIEELEVLTSIFGDQWKKCSNVEDTYSIGLAKDIELWITLNDYYPSNKPPHYELWAPNLARSQKDLIDKKFKEIYETDKGSPIIFQWIEQLKEIIDVKTTLPNDEKTIDTDEFKSDNLINHLSELKTSEFLTQTKEKNCAVLDIVHGTSIADRKSTFQGHVCKITDPTQVNQFIEKLVENKKIREATHNILAYRIITNKNTILEDCDDDGETHAGGRLLHLLEILDLKNVAVVVSRWYGGIHLGPDRFKHINNAGRQALVEAGFIK